MTPYIFVDALMDFCKVVGLFLVMYFLSINYPNNKGIMGMNSGFGFAPYSLDLSTSTLKMESSLMTLQSS